MRILFTGASSFTGYWFVKALAESGHTVVGTFRGSVDDYEGVRGERVAAACGWCEPAFGCSFGDDRFLDTIRGGGFDLLCHHAARTTGYQRTDFDPIAALERDTYNLQRVLEAFAEEGGRAILLTGSVFECDEGEGDRPLVAFSAYGLAKALTFRTFRYYCGQAGLPLAKFVIPNPFGPFEEPRFTTYLVRSWYEGSTPTVRTPEYVRDNIHVSLLALAYARLTDSLANPRDRKLNPSQYQMSQGDFAHLFAAKMQERLSLPCPVELLDQRDFPEPRVRVNIDPVEETETAWREDEAWDELADYYRQAVGGRSRIGVR